MKPLDISMVISIISIVVVLIGIVWRFGSKLGVLDLKVTTLWDIYGIDAIKSARDSGFLKAQSSISMTQKVDDVMPGELRYRIFQYMADNDYLPARTLLMMAWNQYKEELKNLALKNNIAPSILFGIMKVEAHRIKKEEIN